MKAVLLVLVGALVVALAHAHVAHDALQSESPAIDGAVAFVEEGEGLQNDFFSDNALFAVERWLMIMIALYLSVTLVLDLNKDPRVERWLPIARVFPTFEMWRNSMTTNNTRRFDVCKDFPSAAHGVSIRTSGGLLTERDLAFCYSNMLDMVDDDPTYLPKSKKAQSLLMRALPYIAMLSRLVAGILAMVLGFGLLDTRHTSVMTSTVSPDLMVLAAEPGQHVFFTLSLKGDQFPLLYDAVSNDPSIVRRALAIVSNSDMEDVSIAHVTTGPVQYPHDVDKASREMALAALVRFHSTTDPTPEDWETRKAHFTPQALLPVLQDQFSVHAPQAHVQLSAVTVDGLTGTTTTAQQLLQRVNFDDLGCGPIRASMAGHSSAYEHVSRGALCATGHSFNSVCIVQCEEGYMTGDRWGHVAVCGFDSQGDDSLKWLPAGRAYQELCAPDPIHRVRKLVLHLSSDHVMVNDKWRNWAVDRSGPHAECDTPGCFSTSSTIGSDDKIYWRDVRTLNKRGFFWNGAASPLKVSNIAKAWEHFNSLSRNTVTPGFTHPLQDGVTVLGVIGRDVSGSVTSSTFESLANFQSILPLSEFLAAATGKDLPFFLPADYLSARDLFLVSLRARCECSGSACSFATASARINGVDLTHSAPVTQAAAGTTPDQCSACCQSLAQTAGFLQLSKSGSLEYVGRSVPRGSLTDIQLRMHGIVAELAVYADALDDLTLEATELFLASKWGLLPYVAPAAPPAPALTCMAQTTTEYLLTATFPKQGALAYTPAIFALRACYCSASKTTARDCATDPAGECVNVQFGATSAEFPQLPKSSYRVVLQAHTGRLGNGPAWQHEDRPNWQGCDSGPGSVNCYITGPLSSTVAC